MREHKGIRPLVGIPLERTASYAEETLPWHWGIASRGWGFIHHGYNRTDVQRNEFAVSLLDSPDYTHLVMLDMDHTHPHDIVERLCDSVAEAPEAEAPKTRRTRRTTAASTTRKRTATASSKSGSTAQKSTEPKRRRTRRKTEETSEKEQESSE